MSTIRGSILPSLVLNWLKDEIFYSICSRQHCYQGNVASDVTLAWLFGSSASRTLHDFPFNLNFLNSEAKACWGNPTSIILEHTILPFFFPFQSRAQVDRAIEVLKGPILGSLKYRLGLLTGRFGAEHPLKACTACMLSDRKNHGVAYWHLSHQYPGILICPVHHLPLRESTQNRQWSGRFRWFLPTDEALSLGPQISISPCQHQGLEELTNAVLQLSTIGIEKNFELETVRQVYKDALAAFGPSRRGIISAAASLASHNARLTSYPQLSALPDSLDGSVILLEQLTRLPRRNCHPLKHLAVIMWLFGSFSAFVAAYDRQAKLRCASQNRQSPKSLNSVIITIRDNVAITKRVENLRPKILKPPVRLLLLARLAKGESKASICADFGITVSTVNKILRSESKTRESWVTNQAVSENSRRRKKWCSTVKSNPSFGVKHIRLLIPEVYAWLYRNDSIWLKQQTASLPSELRGNHSHVDWDLRDGKLLEAVQAALKTGYDASKVSKEKLNLLVPNLSRSLENKKHYPRSRSFIRELFTKKAKYLD